VFVVTAEPLNAGKMILRCKQ